MIGEHTNEITGKQSRTESAQTVNFYQGDIDKITRKRIGFGILKFKTQTSNVESTYQGQFYNDTMEGFGKYPS